MSITRHRYRVPREDRATYIQPAPADQPARVARNRQRIASYAFRVAGRPVADLRAEARAEAVAAARAFADRWGLAAPDWAEPRPLVLTGHQPQPFHPGVWVKNWLGGALAEAVGGACLNVNVDNDQVHGQVVRLPTRDKTCLMGGDEVRTVEIALAEPGPPVAFEEQPPDRFRPEAREEVLQAVPRKAMADAFAGCCAHMSDALPRAGSVAEAQVVTRHRTEAARGLVNLEVLVSALADGRAFRLFLADALARWEALHADYNASLHEFRAVYRERSAAQPMPDLGRDGRRTELPFWAWRAGEPRARLWVEPDAEGGLLVEADQRRIGRLAAEELADAERTAGRLTAWRAAGWKLRPRALSMTLYLRVLVADVFIHGLGGALYDQIADALIERYWGARAPELVLASCTVHLPLETYPTTAADLRAARRAVRDWRYNPDRMLTADVLSEPEVAALVAEKGRLVADKGATRAERARRWRRVREINRQLAERFPDGPRRARRRLREVRRRLDTNAILRGRDVPYCVHPTDDLVAFYREATRMPAAAPPEPKPCGCACRGRRKD